MAESAEPSILDDAKHRARATFLSPKLAGACSPNTSRCSWRSSASRCSERHFGCLLLPPEHKSSLIRIQREQAEAAAAKIGQFSKEIESQLGSTTQLPWSAGSIEQRRFDALRLLRQGARHYGVGPTGCQRGKERLRVSRLAMDVVASGTDFSNDPKFTEAVARSYHGRVCFAVKSQPYMTLAIAGPGATPE